MNTSIKVWLIIGASLVTFGLIVFVIAMAVNDWDFSKLGTVKYETNTYEIGGEFDKISIDASTEKIQFVPSEDESCRVVCYEAEKVKHSASVQDGTLMIERVDTRKWYDRIGIWLKTPEITVYLPRSEYASLSIDTSTGDIDVPQDFSFENVEIDGSTSDVVCSAAVSKGIKIKTSTGKIKVEGGMPETISLTVETGNVEVSGVKVGENIKIKTSTGGIKLDNVTCKNITAENSTGHITISNVVASGNVSIQSSTGNVWLEDSDAAEIYVRTSTGDVTGTLLSEKIFITDTSTGNIDVPKTTTGGRCEITTSTGDIKISIR